MSWSNRDYKDEKYKAARAAARKRDGYKCIWCGTKGKLVCHHVRRYSDCSFLRTSVANLATLCPACHKKVTGREVEFAPLMLALIRKNTK